MHLSIFNFSISFTREVPLLRDGGGVRSVHLDANDSFLISSG
jgi:hypothetical protein